MSGTLLTGRQALFMVYAAYEIDADRGALYDLSDLMRVTFKTDREMPSFLHTWSRTVQGLSEPQPEGNLRTLLFEQLQKSHALRPDMHYFDRLSREPRGQDLPVPPQRGEALRGQGEEEEQPGTRPSHASVVASRRCSRFRLKPSECVRCTPRRASAGSGIAASTRTTSPVRSLTRRPRRKPTRTRRQKRRRSPKDKPKKEKQDKPAEDAEPRPKPSPEQLAEMAKTPCEMFAKGRCRFGDKCRYLHDPAMQCISLDRRPCHLPSTLHSDLRETRTGTTPRTTRASRASW